MRICGANQIQTGFTVAVDDDTQVGWFHVSTITCDTIVNDHVFSRVYGHNSWHIDIINVIRECYHRNWVTALGSPKSVAMTCHPSDATRRMLMLT